MCVPPLMHLFHFGLKHKNLICLSLAKWPITFIQDISIAPLVLYRIILYSSIYIAPLNSHRNRGAFGSISSKKRDKF